MISDIDLAWAAGLFEGEGSVHIAKLNKKNLGFLSVDIVNTDKEICMFFMDRWKGYLVTYKSIGNRRQYYRWRAAARNAYHFLIDIRTFIRTERVRTRISLGVAFQEQKVNGTFSRHDPEYSGIQLKYYNQMKQLNQRGVTCPKAKDFKR